MRSPRMLLAWLGAGWVACTILWRVGRGEVVVLSGHAAPVIRLVAIVLVFLAGCAEKWRPHEPTPVRPEDMSQGTGAAPAPVIMEASVEAPGFPEGLDDVALTRAYAWSGKRSVWALFAGETPGAEQARVGAADPAIAAAVDELMARITAHVGRVGAGEAETAAGLTGLLDAAEVFHLYDLWLAAHLWQHARTLRPAPAGLLARIERHARVCTALALAEASTGPIEFSAWRSKAGPPRGWTGLHVPAGLTAAARSAFPNADAGTWEAQAVSLTVARGEVVLVRRGVATRLAAGAPLRLRRLDVVRAPAGAELRHARLGALVLPAGDELTAWNIGEHLGPAARAELAALVGHALAGDGAALAEVESLLPAAHAQIRAAVAAKPEAPGAAGLRLVLVNFDE